MPEATAIHKFGLQAGRTTYLASGIVKGHVLNQFSMDEYDAHLRIATTTGRVPNPDVHSTVSVLALEGAVPGRPAVLRVVGEVDNIAPTEDIRSVRFEGDRGFIVTFKKTDPLFALDLSSPEQPAIRGELKIPGFSTYMHMLDDSHILSIGYDADDQGSFAWFQGIMLQLFDISDLSAPKLIHKEVIGARGTSSEAATNHLAFNYFAPEGWLGIPMTVCEESNGGGSYGDRMTFSGLLVYDVDVSRGFSNLGGIAHASPSDQPQDYGYYAGGCYNWWTRSSSSVKRSIFMDDYVYSVADDAIVISHINALDSPVANVPLMKP